jgi:hypothetical protein
MRLREMEFNFEKFKLVGLCETHAVATRNWATISTFA